MTAVRHPGLTAVMSTLEQITALPDPADRVRELTGYLARGRASLDAARADRDAAMRAMRAAGVSLSAIAAAAKVTKQYAARVTDPRLAS